VSRSKPSQSGNPRGRQKGPSSRIKASSTALESEFTGEAEFWRAVARSAKERDSGSLKLITNRLALPLRSESQCVRLDIELKSGTAALGTGR